MSEDQIKPTESKNTDREVLTNRLHLLAGIGVILVGFPVGFHSLQRFSQHLLRNTSPIFDILSSLLFIIFKGN